MVIPFRTIIAINKESSTFGVLANSIAIHTKEKEEVAFDIHSKNENLTYFFVTKYFFSNFFNRDLTYELITQLWGQTMEKLLFSSNSNTNATTVLSPPPPPSDTYLRLFPNEDFSKPSRVDTSSPPPPTTASPNSTTSASTTSAPKMAVSPEITRYTSFVLSSSLNELLFSHTSLSGK